MALNPYEPPKARVDDRSPPELSWWAVWIGASAGNGGGYIIASWVGPFFQHWYSRQGVPVERLYQTMLNALPFGIFVLLATAFTYGLTGYVAASLARARFILHAVLAGIICMVTGAVTYLGVFSSPFPLYLQIAGFALTIPCAIVGAYAYTRLKNRTTES